MDSLSFARKLFWQAWHDCIRICRPRINLILLIASSLSITATLFLFGPVALYANNSGELSSSMLGLLALYAAPASLFCVLLIVLGLPFIYVRPDKVLAVYGTVAVLFYLQGNVFVHPYGSFDGRPIIWRINGHWGYVEGLLWGGGLVLGLVYAKRVKTYLAPTLIFLFTVQIAYLGVLSASTDGLWSARERAPVSDTLFTFSDDRNLIIILLDQFQSTVLTQLFLDSPEQKEIFRGFRYYPNTLGITPSTYLSVPAMLSGKIYDNSQPVQEYMSQAFGEQGLPSVLAAEGFRLDMMTLQGFCNNMGDISCRPVQSLFMDQQQERQHEAVKLLDYTIFRYVPHSLKIRVHNNYEWWLQSWVYPERIGDDGLWRSIEFPRLLRQEGALDAGGPTAKFFHLLLPHPPYTRDENCEHYTTLQDGATRRWGNTTTHGTALQSLCALKVVAQIFTDLDDIGAFHNSDIVILSDHGTGVPARGAEQSSLFYRMETAFPVLMVKRAGASGNLHVDNSALSLADIPRIVGAMLELTADFPGMAPGLDHIPDNRPRLFLNYTWQPQLANKQYIPSLQQYQISGDALDNASWTRLPNLLPPPASSRP